MGGMRRGAREQSSEVCVGMLNLGSESAGPRLACWNVGRHEPNAVPRTSLIMLQHFS